MFSANTLYWTQCFDGGGAHSFATAIICRWFNLAGRMSGTGLMGTGLGPKLNFVEHFAKPASRSGMLSGFRLDFTHGFFQSQPLGGNFRLASRRLLATQLLEQSGRGAFVNSAAISAGVDNLLAIAVPP